MICPRCNSAKIGVVDTVQNDDDREIYRRRKCRNCGKVLYTIEFEAPYDDQFSEDWTKYYRTTKNSKKNCD